MVDTVNNCDALAFKFPSTHNEQKILAQGLQGLSDAGLDTYIAAIDGILIWTDKPSKSECEKSK